MSTAATLPYDGHARPAGGADPVVELYRTDRRAAPIGAPELVGPAEVEAFARDGYLAVAGLLSAAEVADVLAGLAAVLAEPGDTLVEYEAWAAERLASEPAPSGAERMDLVRKLMGFVGADPRLAGAAAQPALLSIVQRLAGEPRMELYQDMALLKPPGGGREKPWHQDNAYFHLEPGTPIIGVWIALDPATVDNGCMHVRPGTHRAPVLHFQRRDLQLCDTDVDPDNDVAVPLEPGAALFFHGLLVHGTPENRTDSRRRAIQFHYVPAATPATSDERHTALFGGDALGAVC